MSQSVQKAILQTLRLLGAKDANQPNDGRYDHANQSNTGDYHFNAYLRSSPILTH
jgi:hypothetical protein